LGLWSTMPMVDWPMILRPKLVVDAVHDVTPALLDGHGLRAVMVDLDDTLVASGADVCDPRFRQWVASLQEAGIPLLILSNGKRERVARWSRELGVQGLPLVGKPFMFAFHKGLALLGSEPAETAMVGDQLFTDVLGANLLGLTSILVTPLTPGGLMHTRAIRHIEKLILRGGDRGGSVHR
jgi:HAD superfamily phosphatase (TIGR01668 family)